LLNFSSPSNPTFVLTISLGVATFITAVLVVWVSILAVSETINFVRYENDYMRLIVPLATSVVLRFLKFSWVSAMLLIKNATSSSFPVSFRTFLIKLDSFCSLASASTAFYAANEFSCMNTLMSGYFFKSFAFYA